MSNSAVLADAQFSAAKVFKPFRDFERVYEGQSVDTPIAIPGTLDILAGKTGFDPNLLSGIPVPLGSKLILWMPTIFRQVSDSLEDVPYQYRIVWRMRNLQDFSLTRAAYHFPKQSLGVGSQYVVPSANHGILWEGLPSTVPTSGGSTAPSKTESFSQSVVENFVFVSTVTKPPLVATGASGAFQQGIGSGGVLGSNTSVSYNAVQLDVVGDEFMILVTRKPRLNGDDTWNFGDTDSGFSAFFGTANETREPIKDLGIYVMTGANP